MHGLGMPGQSLPSWSGSAPPEEHALAPASARTAIASPAVSFRHTWGAAYFGIAGRDDHVIDARGGQGEAQGRKQGTGQRAGPADMTDPHGYPLEEVCWPSSGWSAVPRAREKNSAAPLARQTFD